MSGVWCLSFRVSAPRHGTQSRRSGTELFEKCPFDHWFDLQWRQRCPLLGDRRRNAVLIERGLEFGVWSLVSGVWGLGFGIRVLGFGMRCLGLEVRG